MGSNKQSQIRPKYKQTNKKIIKWLGNGPLIKFLFDKCVLIIYFWFYTSWSRWKLKSQNKKKGKVKMEASSNIHLRTRARNF